MVASDIKKEKKAKNQSKTKYQGFEVVDFKNYGKCVITTDDDIAQALDEAIDGDYDIYESSIEDNDNKYYPLNILRKNYVNICLSLDNFSRNLPGSDLKSLRVFLDELVIGRSIDIDQNPVRPDDKVSFLELVRYFKVGNEILVKEDPYWVGTIKYIRFIESSFMAYLQFTVEAISLRENLALEDFDIFIPIFSGKVLVNDLPIGPVLPDVKERLRERGRTLQQLSLNSCNYMRYSGNLVRQMHWNKSVFRADGRVMIDATNLIKFDPEYLKRGSSYAKNTKFAISDDQLHHCHPVVYGFSFACKKWGEMIVDNISPISFRSDAIDQLVMDQDKKDMIMAIVTNIRSSFTDVIENKSGGCIFLLHGDPGTGKTLTAEAVSEALSRPLYSVSIGELGTTPETLEDRLREILDLAQTWNATLLLDEADIFLERRSSQDIARNAMVGIFLRLLEYHQGVLFLTTNRVNDFDAAFHSRISIALKYPSLDSEFRRQIWSNLLKSAGIKDIDVKELAKADINGRQIKNAIRLGQALAKSENRPVMIEHLSKCVDMSRQFLIDIKS